MARITVEDCLEKIDNQYDLVLLAKERTAQLNAGAPMLVDEDNDKRTIISLREIGDGKVSVKDLEESAIKRLRKEPDEVEQQEEIEALQVINMQVCDDKYGKDYDYSDLGSIGGDTPEEARDNGMKRVCAAASTNTYIDLNRDVCRDRAHENMLFNWQGRVDTIEPYVDAMKETCKSVLPVDNYA